MLKKRVVIGLSGGIDSAVSALLLGEQNYILIGVTGVFTEVGTEEFQRERVRSVCEKLGIELIEREMRETFKETIVDYFVGEYKMGRTPSPCIVCNRRIKFPLLEDVRKEFDCDFIATGHYAKTSDEEYPLMRGKGTNDQAYFLSRVDKEILKRTKLPLEKMGKTDVMLKSREFFEEMEWHSSADICFVNRDYAELVKKRYPEAGEPGPIEDVYGKRIGVHKGIAYYTVGQRRGLTTLLSVPLYVKSIIPEENLLVVGIREECLSKSLLASDPLWLVPPENNKIYSVQTYSTQTPFKARIKLGRDRFRLNFLKPAFQITPGQLAVIYDNEIVVGSGWIE